MTFQFTEQHRDEYFSAGLTTLRGIIPPSLLSALRRETDKARAIARERAGPQSQRLQPVYRYEELNHRHFRDFLELAGMQATVEGILGAGHETSDNMGVLLEPAEQAWCTNWHRDVAHHIPGLDNEWFFQTAANLKPLISSMRPYMMTIRFGLCQEAIIDKIRPKNVPAFHKCLLLRPH